MTERSKNPGSKLLAPLAALATVAVLALGILMGSLFTANARAAGPGPQATTPEHALTVSGNGEVHIQPDMAYLNFQLHLPGATAGESLAAYEKAAAALTARLHALGVTEADIVVNPAATWPASADNRGALGPGPAQDNSATAAYYTDGAIVVTLRDLGKLRDLAMEGLKASTGVGLAGVQYALQNETAARNDAMNKAIDNARSQADAIAAKLGLKVQAVVGVQAQPNYAPSPWMAGGKGAGMAEPGMDPASGANFAVLGSRPDIVVNMTVQVSYSFN